MIEAIRIAISTDAAGFGPNATLLASILRRTSAPVHVRCWCRGFLPESFETGSLKVEFIGADEEVTGKYPGYVGSAVFDRLRVIREAKDWDRCLIMDYDQVALCDLAPLFEMELGENLLAARMQGPGIDMAYAMRTWIKRPLPEGWEHVAEYPYFSMGPLLNLEAMREAGTWEKLMAAHAAFGVDEQLSLTAATEGRTMAFDGKWNLFPKQDIGEGEVPEGVVHWLGWPKPWHPDADVWRPDIWEAEQSSWEHLRMGLWGKPLSLELEPEDDRAALELARRGWRVKMFSSRFDDDAKDPVAGTGLEFPDLERLPGSRRAFQRILEQEAADQVRLGAWEDPGDWLEGSAVLPEYLVLRGGVDAEEADRVRALGYAEEARLTGGEWAPGGPLPRVLEHDPCRPGGGVAPGEDLYLKRSDGWRGGRLVLSGKPRKTHLANARNVGLCVIATANYRMYVRSLLRSVRANFLPGHEVTVFLFTDGKVEEASGVQVLPVEHREWPGMAIGRYPLFRDHAEAFEGMDYLYYLDADMRVIGRVGEEILGDLVATLHPGFHHKSRREFTYEYRRESTAWVAPGEGNRYFAGAFQGGRKAAYLEAVRVMADRIEIDAAKGITAVWHDESHWNRYLIDRQPDVELSPSYCWYPDGRSKEFEGKIAVVLKDAATMRKEEHPMGAARFP